MSNANVSNATIKSFANGYELANTVIDNTSGTVAAAKAGVTEVSSIATSFFAGMRFAYNERRGIKPSAAQTPDEATKAAEAIAKRKAELKAAIEIFNRAHEVNAPVKAQRASKRGVA